MRRKSAVVAILLLIAGVAIVSVFVFGRDSGVPVAADVTFIESTGSPVVSTVEMPTLSTVASTMPAGTTSVLSTPSSSSPSVASTVSLTTVPVVPTSKPAATAPSTNPAIVRPSTTTTKPPTGAAPVTHVEVIADGFYTPNGVQSSARAETPCQTNAEQKAVRIWWTFANSDGSTTTFSDWFYGGSWLIYNISDGKGGKWNFPAVIYFDYNVGLCWVE